MKKKLILGFSSCPNDTFMFDALVNHKIESGDLQFDPHIADIEKLNKITQDGIPDVSKISIASYPGVSDNYQLLDSGCALGYKNGPLIVSKHRIFPDELEDASLAIPGFRTTANLLLTILFPGAKNKSEYLFSDIEEVVLSGEKDAGLIIHESRFTYRKKGLKLVADLGEMWEKKFNSPVPLGGIAVRRDLDKKLKLDIQELIRESVKFAFDNPSSSENYVKQYARELSREVRQQHIELYVNDFSVSLGKKGKQAIQTLFREGEKAGLFSSVDGEIFL